jgi:DNA-binding MarR family transcriptional regulator
VRSFRLLRCPALPGNFWLVYIVLRYSDGRVTKADYETLAAFRYEMRKFLHFSEQAAHAHELTPQRYQALLAIEGFPGRNRITIGELAEQLQIAANSAVGLADRLQSAQLIERTTSEEDRRSVFVSLTPLGRNTLRKLAGANRKELQTVGPLLVGLLSRLGHAS